jgi:hypothetical protein
VEYSPNAHGVHTRLTASLPGLLT